MKELTRDEYQQIIDYVQAHHYFTKGLGIKYVDTHYDTRDQKYWYIAFRHGIDGVGFSANHYRPFFKPAPKQWKYTSLFDLCMAYLKGEFIPKEEFKTNANSSLPQRHPVITSIPENDTYSARKEYLGVEFEVIEPSPLSEEEANIGHMPDPVIYMCQGQPFTELENLMIAIESGLFNEVLNHSQN